MSDGGKKETLSLGGGTRRLETRKSGESTVTRVGKGVGRKTVQVEVRRKRSIGRGAQAKAEAPAAAVETAPAPAPAPPPAPAAEPEAAATGEAGKPSLDTRTRHVLRTLSDEEKAARARALGNARKADEAARQRAEDNARLRQEQEARLQAEREASEARRHEEEERRKTEEEARRKAEEEAARKLHQQEDKQPAPAAAAAARPAPATARTPRRPMGEDAAPARARRPGDRRPPPQRTRNEPRRRANRLTVSEALTDADERQRSLAAMRRQTERRKRQQQEDEGQDLPGKVVREVVVPESITVQELANRMAERSVDVIKTLMGMGVMATVNQTIDPDTAELVVSEFGHKIRRVSAADVEIGLKGAEDEDVDLQPRPPVVTVMGHVDHGKTSLLDAIRATDVVAGEAGGITQHIGAYQVTTASGGRITFIDTPGHEAFTSMRARGAKVTDLVILVVAADDGVMPQTVEAINHAKAAEVPMIVAINKMDLPAANPNRVKQELLQHEIVPEDLGGDVQCVEVSAQTKAGLDTLEEAILLQSEILELTANPERAAEGVVVEAKLDRGRGPVATVLVQRGTLNIGDVLVAGSEWGKVRAMLDSRGDNLEEAGPSMPVEVLGLNSTPSAGDEFSVVESEARAREVSEYRQGVVRDKRAAAGARGTLEQMFSQIQAGERQELPLLVKADVQGSLEAIVNAAEKLGTDEVAARILHAGVGGITESDVELARASDAFVVGFNVRANAQARDSAKRNGVDIRYYSIIYELVDDLRALMSGLLAPEVRETAIGRAEILQVFSITKVGRIAGCRVTEGLVRRNCRARLLRDDTVIHDGPLSSLKRFKDDANEVREGMECGLSLANYQDLKEGDQLEFYEVEEVERTL